MFAGLVVWDIWIRIHSNLDLPSKERKERGKDTKTLSLQTNYTLLMNNVYRLKIPLP